MRFSTVLFDADDTLLDFRRAEQSALRETFTRYSLRTDAEFLSAYTQINHALWDSYNRGEIPKVEITSTRFVRLFAQFDISLDGVWFNERYLDCLSQYGYTLPGAAELCRTLFSKMRLYIVTNGIERVQKSRFEKSGLAPYFQNVFVSETIGVGKPHKAFFDYVCAALPERDKRKILVVGDSLLADIEGGIRANLSTCWCDFQKTNAPNHARYRVESFTQLQRILEDGYEE